MKLSSIPHLLFLLFAFSPCFILLLFLNCGISNIKCYSHHFWDCSVAHIKSYKTYQHSLLHKLSLHWVDCTVKLSYCLPEEEKTLFLKLNKQYTCKAHQKMIQISFRDKKIIITTEIEIPRDKIIKKNKEYI